MITNDRQKQVTEQKIADLKSSLASPGAPNVNPILLQAAHIETMALIEELEQEIKDYEELKSRGVDAIRIHETKDLFLLPIQYRIAKNLSQEQFAHQVGVSVRQISRYETEEYENINGETFKKILEAMPLKLELHVSEPTVGSKAVGDK